MLKVANSVINASQITGVLPVVNGGTGVTTSTGTGNTVLSAAPTLSGDVTLSTGNLVIGTAGKGIDFSVTSSGSGTMTSELLADYEEGTWTPVVTANVGSITTYSASGKYTKIGRLLTLQFTIVITNNGTGSGAMFVDGVPFAAANSSSEAGCGREDASTGVSLAVGIRTTTQLIVNKYDGTYPGVNGYRLDCSIAYTV